MICNPAQMFNGQGANPFEAWQKLWMQGLTQGANAMQVQAPAQQDLPQVGDMFGQFNAMQNMWLQGLNAMTPQAPKATAPANPFMPFSPFGAMPFGTIPISAGLQAPKITVTTIELGDMRPYMEMASNMMSMFQPMLNNWGRK